MSGNPNETGVASTWSRSKRKDSNQLPLDTGDLTDEYKNDRNEKSWQLVPGPYILLLLGVYLVLGYVAELVEENMPNVIMDRDVQKDSAETFTEELAWQYLDKIMGDLPRVAGTPHHLNKTKDIKALIDSIAASANQNVRTDWQLATGNYFLKRKFQFVNYYANASNVIAVLEGESGFNSDGTTSTSILLNCHYDSVPYAMGASDDAVFCAVMAETLHRLSKRKRKFKNNIIFLFNGAEENSLQASHGFLQHPWSKGITTIVNMDAAGMNGKAAVFQVTDPRVLDAFKRTVSKPNAQSLGQFVFSSGVIPSDTDFRIWRDFGHFEGIDIAFAKWGHVYHTRYDIPDLLKPGVMQWSGNMLMALTSKLGDMVELNQKVPPEDAVYYDYMNLFLISYTLVVSYVVDVLIALFGFVSVAYYIWLVGPRMSTVEELLYAVLGRIVCAAAGALATALCVFLMVSTTTQLRYMTQEWIVVPIYWMPFLITAVATSQLYDSWRTSKSGLTRSIRIQQAMAATRAILSIGLILLLFIPRLFSMRYLIAVPLFITSTMSLLSLTIMRYVKLQAWQHLIMEVVMSLPSTIFLFSLALRFDAMMLPIMGRSFSDTPDYTIAMMNLGLVIMVSTTVSGIELLFSKKGLWMVLSALGAVCAVIMFIPFSPYSDEGPSVQRHYWFHTEITTYNSANEQVERTSGLLVSKMDLYSCSRALSYFERSNVLPLPLSLESRDQLHEECRDRVYCNLPVFRTSFSAHLKDGLFVYMKPPSTFRPPTSTRLLNRTCVGESCTYSFAMAVTAHNLITIWPRSNVNITSWSLSAPVEPSFTQLGRPVYVIVYTVATYGTSLEPLVFDITMNVPLSVQSQPVVELSQHSHKIYHPEEFTAEYRKLVESAPAYFNIASFMSFRNNYVF